MLVAAANQVLGRNTFNSRMASVEGNIDEKLEQMKQQMEEQAQQMKQKLEEQEQQMKQKLEEQAQEIAALKQGEGASVLGQLNYHHVTSQSHSINAMAQHLTGGERRGCEMDGCCICALVNNWH
jgi:DNA-binding transcriptional MerR regulator